MVHSDAGIVAQWRAGLFDLPDEGLAASESREAYFRRLDRVGHLEADVAGGRVAFGQVQ